MKSFILLLLTAMLMSCGSTDTTIDDNTLPTDTPVRAKFLSTNRITYVVLNSKEAKIYHPLDTVYVCNHYICEECLDYTGAGIAVLYATVK